MAFALIDGAEGQTTATSGYLYRNPVPVASSNVRTRTAYRAAGNASYAPGQNISANNISTRRFSWNADAGRPLRLREVYLSGAFWQNLRNTNGFVGFQQLGVGSPSYRTKCGYCISAFWARLLRNRATMLLVPQGAERRSTMVSYWFGVFIADTDGWATLTNSRGTRTIAEFFGDTAPGTNDELWADCLYFTRTTSFSRFDDLVAIAPSISVTLQGQPVLAMDDDVVGTTSGASAKVSDFEPSKGRIWLHSWNDQPWQDGETLVDGSNNVIGVINAPNAAFVNGFEPWSYPQWNRRGTPYVLITSPQQDIALTELTPVGNPNNVDNINAVPENASAYNENTASGALSDTYGGYAALPAWVDTVVAVEPEGFVEDVLDGDDVTLTLTDPTGSQSTISAFTTAAPRVPLPEALRADGSAWTPADIPNITVTFTLRNL